MSRPCSPAFHQFFLPRRERGETGQVSEIGLLFLGEGERKRANIRRRRRTHTPTVQGGGCSTTSPELESARRDPPSLLHSSPESRFSHKRE